MKQPRSLQRSRRAFPFHRPQYEEFCRLGDSSTRRQRFSAASCTVRRGRIRIRGRDSGDSRLLGVCSRCPVRSRSTFHVLGYPYYARVGARVGGPGQIQTVLTGERFLHRPLQPWSGIRIRKHAPDDRVSERIVCPLRRELLSTHAVLTPCSSLSGETVRSGASRAHPYLCRRQLRLVRYTPLRSLPVVPPFPLTECFVSER